MTSTRFLGTSFVFPFPLAFCMSSCQLFSENCHLSSWPEPELVPRPLVTQKPQNNIEDESASLGGRRSNFSIDWQKSLQHAQLLLMRSQDLAHSYLSAKVPIPYFPLFRTFALISSWKLAHGKLVAGFPHFPHSKAIFNSAFFSA